ncbi:uncharacterized protein ACMZJ9_001050 [Mantella aurantiaca]
MADIPEETCVFCHEGEEAGTLRNTLDPDILAHFNCLLFSPQVTTEPPQDSQDNKVVFNIPSVLEEIKRGKKLKCSHCKKVGASVGCDYGRCKKTYHYLCVKKASGVHIRKEDEETYLAYCCFHSKKCQGQGDGQPNNETSGKTIKSACLNKSKKNTQPPLENRFHIPKTFTHRYSHGSLWSLLSPRKNQKFDDMPVSGAKHNAVMRYDSGGEQRPSILAQDNHTNEEDTEVAGPSRIHQEHPHFFIRSDSGSNMESSDSNGSSSSQKITEQNSGMRAESERKQRLSDHINHEDMEAPRPCTSPLNEQAIYIGSDSEGEFPVFNGSQLVNIKSDENSSDKSVNGTPSELLKETLSSPLKECHSTPNRNTDSSGSSTPEILRTVSLSGFPKKNRKRKQKRSNPELDNALVTMPSDERNAYSQLYDDVGGSLSMSQDINIYDCDDKQTENSSNVMVEDIPKDKHTGTYKRPDGSNQRIAVSESTRAIKTPKDKSASSNHVHDATSTSQLPRHVSGVTSSPPRQPIKITCKVKNTDSLMDDVVHPTNESNDSERIASISGKMLISAEPASSVDGETNARTQPKDIFNGKDKLVSTTTLYQNPMKPLDDQPLSSSSTNKSSDKQQKSLNINISNEQRNKDTKNKDSVLAYLGRTVKTHAKRHLHFPRDDPGISKTLESASIDTLSNEHVSSPSVNKTSNERPINSQYTSKPLQDQCKHSPGERKTSDKQLARTIITTEALVHSFSDVSEEQTAKVLKRQSQTEAHLSDRTTGTDLLIGQPSRSSLDKNKCKEIAVSTSRAKQTLIVQETLKKDSATSREEVPPTSPRTGSAIASEIQNQTCLLTPQQLKTISVRLQQGAFHERFKNISLTQSTRKSEMTPRSISQSRENDVVSKPTPETSVFSQHTQKYINDVEQNLSNSGNTEDEPAGDLVDDECMLVEDTTHTDEGIEPQSDATHAAVSIAKSSQTEISSALKEGKGAPEANQVSCNVNVLTRNILAEAESRMSDFEFLNKQLLIHLGFPEKVEKPMNLNIDQKNQLSESYKETKKLMSRTGDIKAGAARAFWILCQKNKCQEFLLTLITCYIKSVIHNIVCEEPKDRDFEKAFAILQASGCFADFINGTEEVKDQVELTREETSNEVELEPPETSSTINKEGQCTRDGRDGVHDKVATSLPVSSKVKKSSRNKNHNKTQSELSESSSKSSREEERSRYEDHTGMQCELLESSSKSSREEERSRDEDHGGMQRELLESISSESSRKEKRFRGEDHGGILRELSESSTESSRKERKSRDEDHGGIQRELSESSSESSRKEKRSRDEDHGGIHCELSGSSSESSRKEKRSRGEDHGGMQHELSESSSESSSKEKSSRGEDHGGMQRELFESSSESSRIIKNENLVRMQAESPESSQFSENSRNDVIQLRTIETQPQFFLYPVQHTEDGDATFATYLLQSLRKVPEDKKLSTHRAILNVFFSVLGQQPMSTSNPDCVPQQYTNPSPSRLNGQTPKE